MNLERLRSIWRLEGLRTMEDPSEIEDSLGIKIEEPAVITEAPPEYPFPAGRRCVNIIPKGEGWQVCGNPINRYSEFEVCNVCKTEGRGRALETMLRLQREKGRRRKDRHWPFFRSEGKKQEPYGIEIRRTP